MSWFQQLIEIVERDPDQAREQLDWDGERQRSRANGRSFRPGRLEILTLAELRRRVSQLDSSAAVAQYLERFRADGYHVFHDVLSDGSNIDHVLIGPAGLFTIETKTWSKPAYGQPEIDFDGEAISSHGSGKDRNSVIQARAQADWLRRILQASTGRQPAIMPVVVFPDWFIRSSSRPRRPLWVLEPKALSSWLANQPKVLTAEDIHLFAFHLSLYIRGNEKERQRMSSSFWRMLPGKKKY